MKSAEAKKEFIEAWGSLGSSWGINRTMSSIHALLMSSSKALSTEEIMEALKISRGNANMNIRALIDWGLVKKRFIPGERKEFFEAGKDIWEIARQIASERKKRELSPVLEVIERLKKEEDQTDPEFTKLLGDMQEFTTTLTSVMDRFQQSDRNWFFKRLIKLLS
jgi:DNA-binding transcriptional regulator GbsR (MarR family)